MRKNIILIVIISLIYSCKVENSKSNLANDKKSIESNWYYILKEETHDSKKEDIKTYNEVYIDDKKVFNYTELVGKLKPEVYKVSNDSFFSSDYNGKMIFKGKLDNVDERNFDLVYQSKVITFYKVKEGVTFKDVILKKASLDEYLKDYNKRLLKAKE